MTLSGDWERGPALIRKTMKLNPYYRPVVHHALWVDCLHRGNYEGAYLETMSFKRPELFWYPLSKAATLGLLGRCDEGTNFVKTLLELKPGFKKKGRMLIERYVKHEEIVKRVLDGLNKAGLSVD